MGIAHSVSGSVQKTPGMEPSETPTAAAGDDSPKEIIANRPFTSEPDADPGVVSQTGRKVILLLISVTAIYRCDFNTT